MKTWSLADSILAGSVALTLGAAPFSASLGGSILFHTAMAAAVGGMADWYAVTSLFRKPLGLSFRTELVPRSREKLIGAARRMVEEEILTEPRMYRMVKAHSPVERAASWVGRRRDKVEHALEEILLSALLKADTAPLAAGVSASLSVSFAKRDWASFLAALLKEGEARYGESLWPALSKAAGAFLAGLFSHDEVSRFYQRAWELYEKESGSRSMLRSLLEKQAGIDDAKAEVLIREKLSETAEAIARPESAVRQALEKGLSHLEERLLHDEALREKVNARVASLIEGWLSAQGKDALLSLLEDKKPALARKAARLLVSCLCDDRGEGFRKKADRTVLFELARHLPALRKRLGDAAEKALRRYSGEDMAARLEESARKDLQMIRINGSLVGAILGCAGTLLFAAVKGGMA